jgi:hypothetical protein
VPYAWLRACGDRRDTVVTTYQDDGIFGLSFVSGREPRWRWVRSGFCDHGDAFL